MTLYQQKLRRNWLPSASKRGHKPGAKDSKTLKNTKPKGKTNAEVIKNLKAVQRSVSKLTKKQTAADNESTNSTEASPDPEGKPTTNRTDAALTRQLKKKSGK
jgi:hypothetical protein